MRESCTKVGVNNDIGLGEDLWAFLHLCPLQMNSVIDWGGTYIVLTQGKSIFLESNCIELTKNFASNFTISPWLLHVLVVCSTHK